MTGRVSGARVPVRLQQLLRGRCMREIALVPSFSLFGGSGTGFARSSLHKNAGYIVVIPPTARAIPFPVGTPDYKHTSNRENTFHTFHRSSWARAAACNLLRKFARHSLLNAYSSRTNLLHTACEYVSRTLVFPHEVLTTSTACGRLGSSLRLSFCCKFFQNVFRDTDGSESACW